MSVTEFYESTINRLWAFLTDGQIHLGYWDDPSADFRAATRRLTELVMTWTPIAAGQRFLDVGCGMGMPAIALAQSRGCEVDGVTLSPWQVEQARLRADAAGVAGCRFHVADATALPFEDASFDGGWFFESIFHMGHARALAEARRVLRPGAVLVLTDCLDLGAMSDQERAFARDIANVEYACREQYPALLTDAGFAMERFEDRTPQVMDLFEQRFSEAIAAHRADLEALAGDDHASLEALPTLSTALRRTVGYVLVRARAV